jgi:glycosyltransferase involved in cell wall biosynthesis
VTLVVAGEFYEPVGPIEERIKALGIGEHVRLLNRYVPDEEVGELVAACDVVVLPYRAATQSGVVLVAYAGACPVISTRVGGLPEVVEDGVTGYLVPPEDPVALADAIVRFFERGGRPAFAPSVARAAERYTWGAVVEGIESLVAEASTTRAGAA